jgi:hypothetical protein
MAAPAAELLRATEPRVIAAAAAEIRRLRICVDLSKVEWPKMLPLDRRLLLIPGHSFLPSSTKELEDSPCRIHLDDV